MRLYQLLAASLVVVLTASSILILPFLLNWVDILKTYLAALVIIVPAYFLIHASYNRSLSAKSQSPSSLGSDTIVVIGAGLSGIGCAARLRARYPNMNLVILESRAQSGGTWSLFNYPGIRSDSSMTSLGYSFKPWTDPKTLATGDSILNYLRETIQEHNLEPCIQYEKRVMQCHYYKDVNQWTVQCQDGTSYSCRFVVLACGYYSYEKPNMPEFAGQETFKGKIVHPQFWPASNNDAETSNNDAEKKAVEPLYDNATGKHSEVDFKGKTVAIIGSGATSITLAPNLVKDGAKHVYICQRTPTYIFSTSPVNTGLQKLISWNVPPTIYSMMFRLESILVSTLFYQLARKYPDFIAKKLIDGALDAIYNDPDAKLDALPPREVMKTHFTPPYKPWDQRICVIPDDDMFHSIATGDITMCTGSIESFTPDGISFQPKPSCDSEKSPERLHIDADIIVTATGLTMQPLQHIPLVIHTHSDPSLDKAKTLRPGDLLTYKACMFDGVPNLFYIMGYLNASWTLKLEHTVFYILSVLDELIVSNNNYACPNATDAVMADGGDLLPFTSSYIVKAKDNMPKQGAHPSWQTHQNWFRDLVEMRIKPVCTQLPAVGDFLEVKRIPQE